MLPGLDDDIKRESISPSESPSPVLSYPLPPLPKIGGDNEIMLEIYTHRSLRGDTQLDNAEYGDAWRLSDLGEQVFSTIVTLHYFAKRPLEFHSSIVALRKDALNDQKVLEMTRYYNVTKHLRAGPKNKPVGEDIDEQRHFWYAFIGALSIRNGLEAVQNWVSGIIDPHCEPPTIPRSHPGPSSSSLPMAHRPNPVYAGRPSGQPAAPTPLTQATAAASLLTLEPSQHQYQNQQPPPFSSAPDPNPSNAPLYTTPQTQNAPHFPVAHFHDTVQRECGCQPTYSHESEGPAHSKQWTTRCYVSGVQRGIGVGLNQKQSKMEAARQAWISLGWGNS
ncbi:hypothetical protein BDN72DRAFT_95851 [Pluteus cervinus]|uniref:Uncharacterized protein n=1 Tax=Pluteus cervinus TaxID=181527 RepID=A0ACD3AP13_9AGAR|nr:hypothetical protein BDN72DRAFT_95851 [Pluteus cervinus]